MNDNKPSISINLSLEDIYTLLCAECQDRLLSLISEKAQPQSLKDLLREQFARVKGQHGEH